jgi:hypothetical protein
LTAADQEVLPLGVPLLGLLLDFPPGFPRGVLFLLGFLPPRFPRGFLLRKEFV